jgi:hypothetical protein
MTSREHLEHNTGTDQADISKLATIKHKQKLILKLKVNGQRQ